MLRITKIFESADSVTLKVEGRIVSEWVTVLEQECLKWLQAKPEVLLDFSEVTFIDHNGVAMLKRSASANLRLVNCPALIAEMLNGSNNQEESLDPKDWQAMRRLGHRMINDMMNYLETIRERPVWQPVPQAVRAHLKAPVPAEPQGAESAYQDFLQNVLPHPLGNIHPRFWGWVCGTGTPFGMLVEMLKAAMNSTIFGCDQVPLHVETQVLDWCKEMLGYPAEASGLLVSGATMANLIGLTVARNAGADFNVARKGLQASPHKMTFYGSAEMHSSIQKSAELLGLGSEAIRKIPANADYQIDLVRLKHAIAKDRAEGYLPVCIVGNAGTVNTGAFDDLNALADLSKSEGLWFHIDGAFGALAALSPKLRPLVAGMERADSLAFDLHKWLYMPYGVGCILIRHPQKHHETFSASGAYLSHTQRGLSSGPVWYSEYGVELSRSFRALKVWMSLKEHGLEKYRRLIEQNVEQARFLASRIEAAPELELLAPAPLNLVCFRFTHENLRNEQLNALNQELLIQLHESGVAVPSSTILDGKFALRVAITNHRSRREDFEILVRHVISLGKKLMMELGF